MKYIQSCHWLKKCKSQTIVKLSNRNDSLEILPKKKQLCNIEPAVLDLPQDTKFLLRNVYAPTQGIWNKFLKNIWFIVLQNHWHKACLGWGKWLPYVFYTYGWLGTIVSGGPHWKFLRYDIKLWTCSFICVLKFQNFFLQLVSETAMFYFSIYTHIFHPSLKLSHSFLKLIMPSLQIFFVGHLHSGMKLPWWSIMKV